MDYKEEIIKIREEYPLDPKIYNSVLDTLFVVNRDDYGDETVKSETLNIARIARYRTNRSRISREIKLRNEL